MKKITILFLAFIIGCSFVAAQCCKGEEKAEPQAPQCTCKDCPCQKDGKCTCPEGKCQCEGCACKEKCEKKCDKEACKDGCKCEKKCDKDQPKEEPKEAGEKPADK